MLAYADVCGRTQVRLIWEQLLLGALNIFLLWMAPLLISVSSFAAYTLYARYLFRLCRERGKCVSVSALLQLLQLWRSSVAARSPPTRCTRGISSDYVEREASAFQCQLCCSCCSSGGALLQLVRRLHAVRAVSMCKYVVAYIYIYICMLSHAVRAVLSLLALPVQKYRY